MEQRIIEEKNNELMNRKEIKIIVEADKNPTAQEALNVIAEKFKSEEDVIVVRSVKGKFGRRTFLISAYIYGNREAKEKIEPKQKKGEKKEEKPVEEKKEETPAQ